ncbi:MAG: DUF5518 domain-containing protein [Methanobacteriaceae archaeon]
MLKEIIKWRPLLIGALITVTSYMISYLSGESVYFASFLLGGIIVGFMIGNNLKNGAINGLISGIIAGITVNIIYIIILTSQGYASYLGYVLSGLSIYIVMEVVVSAVGGVFGSVVRAEALPSTEPVTKDEPVKNEN